ncbi:MAG: hypothetical protein ABIP44_09745 [Pseudoxanthomonas sp.]
MTDPKESIGTDSRDMNRDPISGAPGSHPVGVGVGGVAGGAAAGALAGTFFGPIGTLVGAAVGVIAGAATGKGVAERIDPTGETEYWRQEYTNRPYVEAGRDFDRDYASAYGYGLQARETNPGRSWDQTEEELQRNWNSARDTSSLEWEQARGAVRDSWERADRTYSTYEDSDRYFASRFDTVDYRGGDDNFDEYRPAYRYGTQARTRYQDREWDDGLERELKEGWDKTADTSRMTWERAKNAVKDAFSSDDKYSSNRRS